MIATLQRFLVVQGLLLWQGGFLFYTAVVVPIGTNEFGPFGQGRVTREVTRTLNVLGFVVLALLAFGQYRERSRRLTILWVVLFVLQVFLWSWHERVDATIDFTHGVILDYPLFYLRHRVYLWAITIQWVFGLIYTWLLLDGWRKSAASENTRA